MRHLLRKRQEIFYMSMYFYEQARLRITQRDNSVNIFKKNRTDISSALDKNIGKANF